MTDEDDRSPSNAELNLAERQEAGFLQPTQVNEVVPVYAPYAVEDNDTSAYRGVSPEYMTYAEETNKPFLSEEGPEKQAEEDAKVSQRIVRDTVRESTEAETEGERDELIYSATSGEDYTPEDVEESEDDSEEKAARPRNRKRQAPPTPPAE